MPVEIYSPKPKKRTLKVRTFTKDELHSGILYSFVKYACVTCIVDDNGKKIDGGLLFGILNDGRLVRFTSVPPSIAKDAGIVLDSNGSIQDLKECDA